MASFFSELWASIFTPGTTPTLLLATNISFAALQITLCVLLYVTSSIHFVFLNLIAGGLWAGVNWFVKEVEEFQRSKTKEAAEKALVSEKEDEVGTGVISETKKEL